MIERINIVMDRVAGLVSDLQIPAQNPAYAGPTKDEILDVLDDVLSTHGMLESMWEKIETSEESDEKFKLLNKDDLKRMIDDLELKLKIATAEFERKNDEEEALIRKHNNEVSAKDKELEAEKIRVDTAF